MGNKRKRKRWIGKLIIALFLIGIIACLSLFFRKEIVRAFRPWLEKLNLVEARKEITLYFSDPDGEYLIGEKRKIVKGKNVNDEARETINELIKGPKGKLIPTLPTRTKCLSLKVNEKGITMINFNQALSKDHPGGSSAEILTTYSIVNSLALNFPRIKGVQILIDGKPVETITGHLSLKQPISPKQDLIKK